MQKNSMFLTWTRFESQITETESEQFISGNWCHILTTTPVPGFSLSVIYYKPKKSKYESHKHTIIVFLITTQ